MSYREKILVKINGVKAIEEKRVLVTLADTGQDVYFPIDESERFGNRLFIPLWLAKKYGLVKDKSKCV